MTGSGDRILLADTSVWARSAHPALAWFREAVVDGRIAICDQVALELLWSARDAADLRALELELAATPWPATEPQDWRTARQVLRALAADGPLHHRRVGIADLIIAAVAARSGLPLLHYDADYDRIGQVTGQPMRWVAPRGSL